jgi:ATP-dependent DNA ligase
MGEVVQLPLAELDTVRHTEVMTTLTETFKNDLAKLAMNAKETYNVADAAAKMRQPVLEPKLDGIRLLVHVDEGKVEMFSRAGKSKTGALPHVDAELLQLFPAGTWLDAEGVAFNEDGSQNWGGAQSVLGSKADRGDIDRTSVRLVVFDILALEGRDVRASAASERRRILESRFADGHKGYTMLVAQFPADQDTHDLLVARGYEGSMVKDMAASYTSGKRGWAWTKVKLIETADVVVTGFKPGQGKYVDMVGAIQFGQYVEYTSPAGDKSYKLIEERGFCSGMTDAFRQQLTDEGLAAWKGRVIEISYRTAMRDKQTGLPNYRHPQFERVRDDKPATECVVEV